MNRVVLVFSEDEDFAGLMERLRELFVLSERRHTFDIIERVTNHTPAGVYLAALRAADVIYRPYATRFRHRTGNSSAPSSLSSPNSASPSTLSTSPQRTLALAPTTTALHQTTSSPPSAAAGADSAPARCSACGQSNSIVNATESPSHPTTATDQSYNSNLVSQTSQRRWQPYNIPSTSNSLRTYLYPTLLAAATVNANSSGSSDEEEDPSTHPTTSPLLLPSLNPPRLPSPNVPRVPTPNPRQQTPPPLAPPYHMPFINNDSSCSGYESDSDRILMLI